MSKFLGYTIGLECNRGDVVGKMVKAEYTRLQSGSVRVQAVNGRNLGALPGTKTIAADVFSDRPTDPYDSATEARWALALCGWDLMSESAA